MNKKGFLGDMFTYAIVIFIFSIFLIIMYMVISKINTAWQSNPGIPTESKQIMAFQQSRFRPVWDTFMALLVIGYIIAIIMTALFLRSHPVFAMIGLFFLIVMGIVSVHFSNAFFSFSNNGEIATYAQDFKITTVIMQKLPFIIIGFGILFLIVLYAKSRESVVSL